MASFLRAEEYLWPGETIRDGSQHDATDGDSFSAPRQTETVRDSPQQKATTGRVIPDSAHGTNLATAAIAGYAVENIRSSESGAARACHDKFLPRELYSAAGLPTPEFFRAGFTDDPAILTRGEAPATMNKPQIDFRPYAALSGGYSSGLIGVGVSETGGSPRAGIRNRPGQLGSQRNSQLAENQAWPRLLGIGQPLFQ
jgi:hypothetical protein